MKENEKSNKTFTYDEVQRIIEDAYTECYAELGEKIPGLCMKHPVMKGIRSAINKIEDRLLSLME